MWKPDPLRSGAFRFALMIAAVFALGTIALTFMVEHAVSGYATEAANDGISAEVAVLQDEDRVSDRSKTIESVVRRENAVREHQLRYLLVDSHGDYLAGSLPAWVAHVGWRKVTLLNQNTSTDDGAATTTLVTLGARLRDGALLLVASDTSDLDDLRQGLRTSTAVFGICISLLALAGGFLVGTVFLRRLDRVNESVERIMQGSFTERLPAIGMSAEFDHLSTNLNRMLERIAALMEGMRQVSNDIAHDLRTPLTRLRQRLEDIRNAEPGTVSQDQIDAALAQIDQILSVFRALMRISSVEAGMGRQRIVETDLSELMKRLVDAYQPVAEDTEHILVDDIQPGVIGRADPEMLAQAVINLIENAIFHTPAKCTISVGLERSAGGISIVVADNGPGIPDGERARVMARFYRLDGSRGTPGAGLGLALVAAVAAIHEANFRLSDNHPGLRVELSLTRAMPGASLA
jgi:signal transduction histidine kinase